VKNINDRVLAEIFLWHYKKKLLHDNVFMKTSVTKFQIIKHYNVNKMFISK